MGLLILPIHYYTPANLSFTMLQLLLALALCSVANVSAHTSSEAEIFRQLKEARTSRARTWRILRYVSNNFENLGKLHEEITTKTYSKEDLNQAWEEFENKCGSYEDAQNKWWDFLQSEVEAQHGTFTRKLLTEGRMGSTFAIKFRRRSRLNPGHQLCLKLPKSFKGTDLFDGKTVNVWEANVNEFAMAQDFKKDQQEFPCHSITDHIDIQHGAGRGSYILLPLFDQDLRKASLSPDQAVPMMEDLLMACRNLHEQMGRVHGDLIKANIMTTRDTGRFVVIDVLSEKEYNKDNIIRDLKNIKDLPELCFKADVKAVSGEIAHLIEKAGESKTLEKVKTHFFRRHPFTGKLTKRTITVSGFRKIVPDLTEPAREQLKLSKDLSERFDRLAYTVEKTCDSSKRVRKLCKDAKSLEDASLIAGKVLTEFFGF